MPDSRAISPQPEASPAASRARPARERVGRWLTLTGSIMTVVGFFCPWLDVFKTNDPTYPFPQRGYSPWMLLASGRLDASVVVTGLFLLLILGMAAESQMATLAPGPSVRSQAKPLTGVLALMSLVLMIVSVYVVSFDLSFFWPFLNSSIAYGLYLSAAGTLAVLAGIAALPSAGGADARHGMERATPSE